MTTPEQIAMSRGIASVVREALRHSPGELCSCMRDDEKAKHRGCCGVCEDAVDRVVAALQQAYDDAPSSIEKPL